MSAAPERRFASRAGAKLDHALETFDLDVTGWRAVDLGCNVGGFTDCLLQRGAAHVIAVDTGYGVLDYRLRSDDRVTVRERTNALHAEPSATDLDLAVIDLGWTRQSHAIPAACRWLRDGATVVTLIKPHYEAVGDEQAALDGGQLDHDTAQRVAERVLATFPDLGVTPHALTPSPLVGGKSSRKGAGNAEFLALGTLDR